MKKSTLAAAKELTRLIGCHSFERVSQRCTGKWGGTSDYGLFFDNGIYYFISNGMADFEQNITKLIADIKTVQNQREYNLEVIRRQVDVDNKLAESMGFELVKVLDVGVNCDNPNLFLWAYLMLEVNGRKFRHADTRIDSHLRTNTIDEWSETLSARTKIAGAVLNPDYIIGNICFSSTDKLYKIND